MVAPGVAQDAAPGDAAADLLVIGAGLAGLTAAVRAASQGLGTVLVERSEPGGRVRALARVETFPGHPVGLSGEALVARSLERAWAYGVEMLAPAEAVGLEGSTETGDLRVILPDGPPLAARAVLLAVGSRAELPRIPGLDAWLGRGVHTELPAGPVRGLASGDVLLTGPEAPARGAEARRLFPGRRVRRLRAEEVAALDGVDRLETVVLGGRACGCAERPRSPRAVRACALYVLGSPRAPTAWLPPSLLRDARGFVRTGADLPRAPHETGAPGHRSSLAGVYAAGAVRAGCPPGAGAVEDALGAVEEIRAVLASRCGARGNGGR